MQIGTEGIHEAFIIATPIVLVAVSWVGLLIKGKLAEIQLEQGDAKAELVKNQTDIARDLQDKHQENTKAIAVHTAEDKAIFDGISRTLQRIDGKLDKLSDWQQSRH